MNDSSLSNEFKTYLEIYQIRNLDTKEVDQPSCENGTQWVWLAFGECLVCRGHKLGYFAGALSLLLRTTGCFLIYKQIYSRTVPSLWNLIAVTFAVNLISCAGAVMSLQMLLLILYDMVTTVVTMAVMLLVAVLMLARRSSGQTKYRLLSAGENDLILSAPPRQHLTEKTYKICCYLFLCLAITTFLSVVIVSVSSFYVLTESSTRKPSSLKRFQYNIVLTITGYVFGCLACFGRWWTEIFTTWRFANETRENITWKGGGAMLFMSDIMYILGVLLQSSSFRGITATLPWLAGRTAPCCFQVFAVILSWRMSKCWRKRGEHGDKVEEQSANDSEETNLLRCSKSEECDTILLDHSRNIQGHEHCKEKRESQIKLHTLNSVHEATTSTDSDLSSTTQDREFLQMQNETSGYRPAESFGVNLTSHSQQRLSLTRLRETLSETSDQRIRSWISQSTPEEKLPPCLTLTLNLDTAQDDVNNTRDETFKNRKFNFCWALPLSPRKNSF